MLMKICQRCGRRIPQNQQCSCKSSRHKLYNKHCRDETKNEFYHSRQWRKIVEQVKARANGLDEYSLAQGKIELGNTAHHVYPIDERPDLKLSLDNLIYVSSSNHNKIHSEYNKNNNNKYIMQSRLIEIISKSR